MTRKLEELFDLPTSAAAEDADTAPITTEETRAAIIEIDATIDKIDAALPGVRDLDSSDQELDDIAAKATETFENLSDLGFNVDSRYAAELFAVAGTMLGHALTAKTTKLQKKLKVLDLQMKKLKLDQDAAKNRGEEPDLIPGQGEVLNNLSRNELLERLIGNRDQNNKSA
jgi:hypothetical protein